MPRALWLFAVVLALQVAVSAQEQTQGDRGKLKDKDVIDCSKQLCSLAITTPEGNSDGWFNKMGELPLSEHREIAGIQTYRLVFAEVLRIDGPMVVRVEVNPDGSSEVYSKWLVNRKEPKSKHYQASLAQTEKLLQLIEDSGFWNQQQQPLTSGVDGSWWTLEGLKDGKYHSIEEWSPNRGEWLRRVGDQMLSLGHAPLKPRD